MPPPTLTDRLAARPLRLHSPPRFYRCEPAWSWAPPPLPDYDLWYVLDGDGEVQLDGRRYRACAQHCFLFQPGARIVARHDPRRRLRVFAVHFAVVGVAATDWPPPVQPIREAVLFGALARHAEVAWRQGDPARATSLVAEMVLYLCAAAHHPPVSVTDSRVAGILDAVREDPSRHWSVSELARRAGLSRAQFARRLTAATGLAPERFLIQCRLDRAQQLLAETDLTVSQIADALGYRDVYYFSRQFARATGRTASAFRQALSR